MKYRTALMVCYGAGLRVSDAVKLTPADIDAERMTIRIEQGKGNKDRYALLSPRVLEIIRAWQEKLPATAEWLFPSWFGKDKHISIGSLQRACQEARYESGIPKNHYRSYPAPQLGHSSIGIRYPYNPGPALGHKCL